MIATLTHSTSMGSAQPREKRTTWDGRLFLKVKLKSLAAESRIIRQEERKGSFMWNCLRSHRIFVVRTEARATSLAYGFLRGRSYHQIEAKCHEKPDWKKIEAMVKKYGKVHGRSAEDTRSWREKFQENDQINTETMARFQAWKESVLTAKKE